MLRVVVVGERGLYLGALTDYLNAQQGVTARVMTMPSNREALGEDADVVVLDCASRLDTDAALVAATARFPEARVVVLTGGRQQGSPPTAGRASLVHNQIRAPELLAKILRPAQRESISRRRPVRTGPAALQVLSDREHGVLELMVSGLSAESVAEVLAISPHTVRTHLQNIMTKLDVRTRVELMNVARRAGLRSARPRRSLS